MTITLRAAYSSTGLFIEAVDEKGYVLATWEATEEEIRCGMRAAEEETERETA